jgi:hypothetical protein
MHPTAGIGGGAGASRRIFECPAVLRRHPQAPGRQQEGIGGWFASPQLRVIAEDHGFKGSQPGMAGRLHRQRAAAAARDQRGGDAELGAAGHQLGRPGHRAGGAQQPAGNRLLHRQQFLIARCGVAGVGDPPPHLGAVLQPSASPQLQQFRIAQRAAEVVGRLAPGLGVQRLGIEQQPIEIEQAGSGKAHSTSLPQGRQDAAGGGSPSGGGATT